MRDYRYMATLISAAALTLIAACPEAHIVPVLPEPYVNEDTSLNLVQKVDLLFVVDNSASMTEEQERLAAELPKIVQALITGDFNGDGAQDINPVTDIHVGVVTSDLGSPLGPASFVCSMPGDDGVLGISRGVEQLPGMRFASYAEGSDEEEFVENVLQLVTVGAEGCGIERPIGALAKAITRSDQRVFDNGTGGRADDENAGFLRDDALLATILVTDEEDCSSVDEHIPFLMQGDPDISNVQCQRCAAGENGSCMLSDVRELASLIIGGDGAKEPAFFVFSGIIGLPSAAGISSRTYDAWLGHPEMNYSEITWGEYKRRYGESLTIPDTLLFAEPVCALPDGFGSSATVAAPGLRLVSFAKDIDVRGGRASVHSICEPSFERAIRDTATDVADVLSGSCLPQQLPRDENGFTPCEVLVTLPLGVESCEGRPGLSPQAVPSEGKATVCKAIQRGYGGVGAPPTEPGWFYEENPGPSCPAARQQRINFVDPEPRDNQTATKPDLALVRARCDLPVPFEREVTVGTPCLNDPNICDISNPANEGRRYDPVFGSQLACSELVRTCQIVCDTRQASNPATCPETKICYRKDTAMMALVGSNREQYDGLPWSGFCLRERKIEELDR